MPGVENSVLAAGLTTWEEEFSARPSAVWSNALGVLGRTADVQTKTLEEVLRTITETAARCLSVFRVNVWLHEPDRSGIRCIEAFDVESGLHYRGERLAAAQLPSYFRALDLLRTVDAMDAEHDPRTAELTELYLVPHGISTILDVPLVRSGTVIGVVCHEHRGTLRKWTETERLFAGSIGDLVTLALETDERITLEAEQRRLTARVEQMEKLQRQTDMAARVAHDFRNLLTPIFAHFDCFGTDLPPGPLAESAQDVLRAAERARALCDELMTYAGGKLAATHRVNLAEIAEEVVRQQRTAMPRQATLSLQVEGAPPPVAGEPGQLHRAITNLVVNAAQAVAASGSQVRVTVKSDVPTPSGEDDVFDFRTAANAGVLVEVADDGPGIQPEHRPHLFEPFFTTKAKGNGLGLPSVLGVVRGHAGLLSVRHGQGRGATFRIWLPTASA